MGVVWKKRTRSSARQDRVLWVTQQKDAAMRKPALSAFQPSSGGSRNVSASAVRACSSP